LNYKPVIERKKKVKTFCFEKYRKEYYEKNKEVLKLISKAYRLRKKGIKCLEIIIN